VLGTNWSGTITFKEDHELIQRGPYAYVRHPIYSGLLLMGLGTAVESGRLASFGLLAAVAAGFAVKAHLEERLMTRHFPEAYPPYRRRVRALIPGVW
jgi:protein-S-isoprenylcysteine O-methyltransferase Ste14